jgi:hypothetical protein
MKEKSYKAPEDFPRHIPSYHEEIERCALEYVSASPDDIHFAHLLVVELEKNLDRIL